MEPKRTIRLAVKWSSGHMVCNLSLKHLLVNNHSQTYE